MNHDVTRRTLLLTGSALLISSCTRRGQATGTARSGGVWYVVKEGDTISALSRRSGVSIQGIIDANKLASPHLIPNTSLWFPGVTAMRDEDPLAPREQAVAADVVPSTTAEDTSGHEEIAPPPPGGYVLVPRSAWTSQRLAANNRAMGVVSRITLHHTGEHAGMDGLPDVEVIRRIERYHRNERHWAAIGYHFIVGRDAKIYEGRPAVYQGAHVLSENPNNLGISVIGDFQNRLPSERQLAALRSFLDDERDKFKVARGRVYGHRDLNKSICPGDALYGWLTKYKQA